MRTHLTAFSVLGPLQSAWRAAEAASLKPWAMSGNTHLRCRNHETMIVSTIALTPERCEAPEEVIRIRFV
jgi:hypothetical protein